MWFALLYINANGFCSIGYGLTEASPLTHCNGPEGNKYHTIGPAVPNTQFKVSNCTLTCLDNWNKRKRIQKIFWLNCDR